MEMKMEEELNEEFWIKKTIRSIVRDAKKDIANDVLTATLADTNGTQILIKGDPSTLEWLKPGLDVNVSIKAETAQSTLAEKGKGYDDDWNPKLDE
jgi:hypothetical protein